MTHAALPLGPPPRFVCAAAVTAAAAAPALGVCSAFTADRLSSAFGFLRTRFLRSLRTHRSPVQPVPVPHRRSPLLPFSIVHPPSIQPSAANPARERDSSHACFKHLDHLHRPTLRLPSRGCRGPSIDPASFARIFITHQPSSFSPVSTLSRLPDPHYFRTSIYSITCRPITSHALLLSSAFTRSKPCFICIRFRSQQSSSNGRSFAAPHRPPPSKQASGPQHFLVPSSRFGSANIVPGIRLCIRFTLDVVTLLPYLLGIVWHHLLPRPPLSPAPPLPPPSQQP